MVEISTIILLCLGICYVALSLAPMALAHRKVSVQMFVDKLKIKGLYGRNIPYSKIKEIKLTSTLPQHLSRKRATSFNGIRKGLFRDEDDHHIYLHLDKDYSLPLVEILETDDTRTYFSVDSREENRRVFNHIESDLRRLGSYN